MIAPSVRRARVAIDQAPRRTAHHNSHNTTTIDHDFTYLPTPSVPFRLLNRDLGAAYFPAFPRSVDFYHLWNRVNIGPGRWGVTFEYGLPRIEHKSFLTPLLQKRFTSDKCRFLVAISDHAMKVFREQTKDSLWQEVCHKVHRVYPKQLPAERQVRYHVPQESEALRLVLVGHDFFRKGGESIVRVLLDSGEELNLHLTVISQVREGDYAAPHIDRERARRVKAVLRDHPRISWVESASRGEVDLRLSQSHIGVLPTLADTFGYSLLEAMAQGLPVVGSNVQAMNEIVTPECGWQVQLPVDDAGNWMGLGQGAAEYDAAITHMAAQLQDILTSIRSTSSLLGPMAQQSQMRIWNNFYTDRDAQMRAIYQAAVVS